jgi:molecular chaperone HtpG
LKESYLSFNDAKRCYRFSRYSIESRSGLQADAAVKKISNYITRKVADKLKSLFTENREDFEKKWNDIVLEYGMLSEDKFYENQLLFYILQLTTSFIH